MGSPAKLVIDEHRHDSDARMMPAVYADHNATTPLAPSVRHAVSDAMEHAWGNPSSSYETGVKARRLLETARGHVAAAVGCADPNDIIFTSGGTEANNSVIMSAIRSSSHGRVPHVVYSAAEHDAIIVPLKALEKEGRVRLSVVPVGRYGSVSPTAVAAFLSPETVLVTIMLANNETGVIQPVAEVVSLVRDYETAHQCKILVHTDAAQCIGKIPVDVTSLGVDYITVVGHKFNAPRIGALYARHIGRRAPVLSLALGGGQERGYRHGTENTPMIAGLGEGARLATETLPERALAMRSARDAFEALMRERFGAPSVLIQGVDIYGGEKKDGAPARLPNTSNMCLLFLRSLGLDASTLLEMARPRFLASVGAACHSHDDVIDGRRVMRPSAILLAMGVRHDDAVCAIRVSFGAESTVNDARAIVEAIDDVIRKATKAKL